MATMKHVGLNVAADTFMSLAYQGAVAGLVILTADDPGMWSSQNEQDNRIFGKFAGSLYLFLQILRRLKILLK